MKIAVITHHWVPNFGAFLQAFSSFNFIKQKAVEIQLLNYRRKPLEELYFRTVPESQREIHESFINKYMIQSPLMRSEDELVEYSKNEKFDLIIAGSDSIFRLIPGRPGHEGKFPNPYWLDWVKNKVDSEIKTAIMAGSSMGTTFWRFSRAEKKAICKILKSYDMLSVRDRWTLVQFFLISKGKTRAHLCPDPVSVLNKVLEQMDIADITKLHGGKAEKNYFLLSFPLKYYQEEWVKNFVKEAHKYDIGVYSLPLPAKTLEYPVDKVIQLPLSPLEWYCLIKESNGIITDRFHPIVCAGLNSVPFISIDNNSPGRYRFFPYRLKSKQYDFCYNMRKHKFCNTSVNKLSAVDSVRILRTWKKMDGKSYIENAQSLFSQTIDKILDLS